MAVEGDLLMPVPSWVSYKPQARMLNTNVIKVQAILDDRGFQINPNTLRKTITDARAQGLNPSRT
jgi:aspartate/methionine/tyrosine aminotransferase